MKREFNGYTLIEVIVAVAIFALLVTPIVLLIQQSIKVNVSAKRILEVAQVINEAVETLVYQNVYGNGALNIGNYRVDYSVDDTYKTGTIQNIQNSEIDFRMFLDSSGVLQIENIATHTTYTRNISSTSFDKLKLNIKYDEASKQAIYTFYLNNAQIASIVSGNVSNPAKLGGEFVSNSTSHYLYVIIDGVYDNIHEKLTQNMFNLWLTNIGNNIKIIATTPFIVYENSARHAALTETEKVKKIELKVYNINGELVKEYTTYYSYRVK
ncbi:type IV pilus modification PilV family protein [Caldicellulosiruptor changbaiensis]|nr:type II secretion system protein [Caldicellulosiruptor changbaiensis]